MRKSVELRRRTLEQRLQSRIESIEGLEEQQAALYEQKSFTISLSDQQKFQKQIEFIQKQIDQELKAYEQDEAELEKLLQGQSIDSPTQPEIPPRESLLAIVAPYEAKIGTALAEAYRLSRVAGWERSQPSTLKGILLDLDDMQPDEQNILPIVKFAAALVSTANLPPELYPLITDWGKQRTAQFDALQEQVQRQLAVLETARQQSQSYLFILVKNSQITSNEYLMDAWLISDDHAYNPNTGEGSMPLNNLLSDRETYRVSDLEILVQGYLEQCKSYKLKHLTIEVFLPLPLLNEAVDSWKRQEYGLPPVRISCDYRLVVRSSERLKDYGYWEEWEQKWNTLARLNQHVGDLCVEGDLDLETLLYELGKPESVILKLGKAPEQVGTGSVFAALLKTATPIALWIRRNLPILPYQISELNNLLKCCPQELPAQVREKRRETLKPDNKQEDSHIGHHLALLWEDPSHLPPSTIEYAPPGL